MDAEHVVILMQENRSSITSMAGCAESAASTIPEPSPCRMVKPVWLQSNAAGETYAPFHLDLKKSKVTWLGSAATFGRDQTDAPQPWQP
jgi:phospholipase C